MKRLSLVALIALCAVAAACGGNSYGNKNDFNGSGGGGNLSLTDPTPSATPASSLGSRQPGAPSPVAKPVQSQAPPAAHFAIAINGDNSGQPAFMPLAAEVYTGTIITFTNRDSVPRSVVSDPGDPASFNSGPIAPGASWTYTANVAGKFNYHDGTRPYAVAYFQAVAH